MSDPHLTVVPANEASWADLNAVFGTGQPGRCRCQRYKVLTWIWRDSTQQQREDLLREQTGCEEPDAPTTSGLVGYLDGEPVGWIAVEPRTAFPKLRTSRVPWTGRTENKDDDGVWAITCVLVRAGYRGRGLTHPLTVAAAEFARQRGARAVEGYAMVTEPGKDITWGELSVGARQVYLDAGFAEVSRPTLRRAVMRIDFAD